MTDRGMSQGREGLSLISMYSSSLDCLFLPLSYRISLFFLVIKVKQASKQNKKTAVMVMCLVP